MIEEGKVKVETVIVVCPHCKQASPCPGMQGTSRWGKFDYTHFAGFIIGCIICGEAFKVPKLSWVLSQI